LVSRILLDTQVLLWSFFAPKRFPSPILDELTDSSVDVLFSAASIWEIAIKSALGRADFAFDPGDVMRKAVQTGFRELSVLSAAACLVARLPLYHRDPFDRLLVAQAIAEPAHLLTSDGKLQRYSELVCWFEPRQLR
jgi:PIN domain nuclease of toxin-antitoxin system